MKKIIDRREFFKYSLFSTASFLASQNLFTPLKAHTLHLAPASKKPETLSTGGGHR